MVEEKVEKVEKEPGGRRKTWDEPDLGKKSCHIMSPIRE